MRCLEGQIFKCTPLVSCQIRVGSASEAFTATLGLNAFTVLMINFISIQKS
jgi:hypothetical protein